MKFSWIWLNQVVKINNINLNQIVDNLTLAGFELDGIENIKINNDTILDISITPNRSDVSSIMGLAKEINTIFKIPIIQQFAYNYLYTTNLKDKLTLNSPNLKYTNYTRFNYINNNQSPEWMQNYLISYNTKPLCLLKDIIHYIKLKWNYDIYICTLDQIVKERNQLQLYIHQNHHNINTEKIAINNSLIIYSFVKKCEKVTSSYIDFQQSYNEAVNLIQTYGKATIGKLHQYYNHNNKIKNYIFICKDKINNILGPITKPQKQYLSTIKIINLLEQLNLQPTYNKEDKNFKVIIPEHRLHDLTRDIDIIEEISRIYGFNNFHDQLLNLTTYKKGHMQISTRYIFHIRQILRHLGLHETVNSSFIHYSGTSTNQRVVNNISLYNPMNEYHSILRINIIDNLLHNYVYNYKQKNTDCEFFEISKIFRKCLLHKTLQEFIHLGIILTNNTFTRISWSDKPISMNWFHAKGLIEEFLYKLNAEVIWKPYKNNTSNNEIFPHNQINLFNKLKTSIIYDSRQKIPIGIFGEIDKKNFKNFDDTFTNTNIYGFEVNLLQLIKAIKNQIHTEYLIQTYSLYPTITRDISFNLSYKQNVNNIIEKIHNTNIEIIESIQIFNEYYNRLNNMRSIGLRIIYRSKYRTLQIDEIENTHIKIQKLLQSK